MSGKMRTWMILTIAMTGACKPTPKTGQTSVAGRAMLVAPIVGAHVRITLFGATDAEVAADTVTDKDGRFDVPIVNGEGTILVEVLGDQGGTTNEPISQKPLQLSYTDRFTSMSANVTLGQQLAGIVVSPWSTMLTARAQWDMVTNKTSAAAALANAANLFLTHFDGIAFMSSEPTDPAVGPTNGLPSSAIHGFVTSGLAAMGVDLSRRLSLSESDLISHLPSGSPTMSALTAALMASAPQDQSLSSTTPRSALNSLAPISALRSAPS
jgi:hypothetical protein